MPFAPRSLPSTVERILLEISPTISHPGSRHRVNHAEVTSEEEETRTLAACRTFTGSEKRDRRPPTNLRCFIYRRRCRRAKIQTPTKGENMRTRDNADGTRSKTGEIKREGATPGRLCPTRGTNIKSSRPNNVPLGESSRRTEEGGRGRGP